MNTLSACSSASPWVTRVAALQEARATPAMRAELLARAERERGVRRAYLSAHAVQQRSSEAFEQAGAAFRSVRAYAAAPPAAASWNALAASASPQLRAAGVASRRAAAPPPGAVAAEAIAADEAVELPEVAQWDALLAGGGAAAAGAPAAAAADGADELARLLDVLRVEPPEGAECAAKFELFEAYLGTVAALRGQVMDASERARAALAGVPSAIAGINDALKRIDAPERLGAADQEGVWLVHGMATACAANHGALSAALRGVETKLRLLLEPKSTCP